MAEETSEKTFSRFKHVRPLNLQLEMIGAENEVLPIAACDCDGYCNHTNVCVAGDVEADVDACALSWG